MFIPIHTYLFISRTYSQTMFFFLKMWYMLSINETYVFMNFDLVVVQVYKDLYSCHLHKWAILTCSLLEVCQEGGFFWDHGPIKNAHHQNKIIIIIINFIREHSQLGPTNLCTTCLHDKLAK
jgi:hypothetical protein